MAANYVSKFLKTAWESLVGTSPAYVSTWSSWQKQKTTAWLSEQATLDPCLRAQKREIVQLSLCQRRASQAGFAICNGDNIATALCSPYRREQNHSPRARLVHVREGIVLSGFRVSLSFQWVWGRRELFVPFPLHGEIIQNVSLMHAICTFS